MQLGLRSLFCATFWFGVCLAAGIAFATMDRMQHEGLSVLMLGLAFVSPFAACGALYRNAWIGQVIGLLIGIVVGIAVQMLLLFAMGLGILPITR